MQFRIGKFGRPLSTRIDLDAGQVGIADTTLGMITPWERRALSALGERIWANGARREGLIVDAGPFVGASTLALAEGLARSSLTDRERRSRIWSYDLFVATTGMEQVFFGPTGPKAGESFRPVYDANIAPFRDYVRVYEGDIRTAEPPGPPVAILFVDILWDWDATTQFSRTFYPKLDPRRSVLVHQDFNYPYYPWLILSMGTLLDYFSIGRSVAHSTLVFDVKRRVRAGDIDDPRNVGVGRALKIYDDFIDAMEGFAKGALALGKALFLSEHGRTSEARELVSRVQEKYAADPLVMNYVPSVLEHTERVDRGVAKPLDQVSGY
jgi:hypothetical protein